MTPDVIAHELESFKSEFAPYLSALAIDVEHATTTFTTREQETYCATVSDAGWQCRDIYYATSQEMLNQVSALFTQEWGTQLLDRIHELAASTDSPTMDERQEDN